MNFNFKELLISMLIIYGIIFGIILFCILLSIPLFVYIFCILIIASYIYCLYQLYKINKWNLEHRL